MSRGRKGTDQKRWLYYIVLFTIPLAAHLYLGLVVWADRAAMDEILWYIGGQRVIQGILTLNPNLGSYINGIWEHPPFGLLVIGIIDLIFTSLRIPFPTAQYFLTPTRIVSALGVALVSCVMFKIGKRCGNSRTGVLAWLLTFLSLVVIPYEYWAWVGTPYRYAEINGFRLGVVHWYQAPNHTFATVEVWSLPFVAMAMNYAMHSKGKKDLLKSGVFYGLASLTRFSVFPTMAIVFLAWFLYKRNKIKEAAKEALCIVLVGGLILFLGCPAFWSLESFFKTMIWYESPHLGNRTFFQILFLSLNLAPEVRFQTQSYVLFSFLAYPTALFLELWTLQLALLFLIIGVLKGRKFGDGEVFALFWFSSMYLFHSQIESAVWRANLVSWYDIQYLPPLALFCALNAPKILAELSSIRGTNPILKDQEK